MEGFPPSYQNAVASLRDHWRVIAPYVRSKDLYTASLVCREWHEVFTPLLWGNPASHFDDEVERNYGKVESPKDLSAFPAHTYAEGLTQFRSVLRWTRLQVRQLTHTLRLPNAYIDFYDGSHPVWLRELLIALPNIQTLIVSGVPSFDHQAVLALRYGHARPDSAFTTELPLPFNTLKLLDASCCFNVTVQSLLQVLSCFPNLAYLDLSRCIGTRNHAFLSKLGHLPELQILKLRNCGLRNTEIQTLVHAIAMRLRCLDLTGNYLDDEAIEHLLESCYRRNIDTHGPTPSHLHMYSTINDTEMAEAVSMGSRRLADIMQEVKHQQFDEYLVRQLTSRAFDHLALQGLPYSGIMHLYISDNLFSAKGISKLINEALLITLDIGDLTPSLCTPQISVSAQATPVEAEHLVSALAYHNSNLKYFRVHYAVLSGITPTFRLFRPFDVPDPTSIDFSAEAPAPDYDYLGDPPAFGEQEARNELASCNIQRWKILTSERPPNSNANSITKQDRKTIGSEPYSRAPSPPHGQDQYSTWPSGEYRSSKRISPPMLKDVITLVLTNIASRELTSNVSPISAAIINFIAAAAEYESSPDFYNAGDLRHFAKQGSSQDRKKSTRPSPLALQRIVLEVDNPSRSLPITSKTNEASEGRSLSSTEDPDSENFWTAAENDYSFFGDDEKVKLPKRGKVNPGAQEHSLALTGKDVVQEIARFRRERREQYVRDRAEGKDYTWGYWKGEVRVVRPV